MIGKHLALHHLDSVTTSTVGSVKLSNGHITKAVKLESIRLTITLTLQNVFHVPAFDSNLLSLSKFAKDRLAL